MDRARLSHSKAYSTSLAHLTGLIFYISYGESLSHAVHLQMGEVWAFQHTNRQVVYLLGQEMRSRAKPWAYLNACNDSLPSSMWAGFELRILFSYFLYGGLELMNSFYRIESIVSYRRDYQTI